MPRALPLLLLVGLLAGCSDQALVDRVAQLEAAQDRLRTSIDDLDADDPDATDALGGLGERVDTLGEQLTAVESTIAGLEERAAGDSVDVDGRLTGVELQLDDLRALLTQVEGDLTTLTDRVASLEAQLDSHREDPFGHGG